MYSKLFPHSQIRTSKRHSQGFGGRREHGYFELGNRVTISKYFREQGKKTNLDFRDQKAGTDKFESNLGDKETQSNI